MIKTQPLYGEHPFWVIYLFIGRSERFHYMIKFHYQKLCKNHITLQLKLKKISYIIIVQLSFEYYN
jgi:hypothetical protein